MASPGPGPPPKPLKPTFDAGASDRNSKLSALLQSIDADLGFTKNTPTPVSEEYSVNSFRRAKFFFPKLLEEQRKAAEAEKAAAAARKAKAQAASAASAAKAASEKSNAMRNRDKIGRSESGDTNRSRDRSLSADRRFDHETKRRRVSRETPTSDLEPSSASQSSPGAQGQRTKNGQHGRNTSMSPCSISSSPLPEAWADKGKKIAVHPASSEATSTHGSPGPRQRRTPPPVSSSKNRDLGPKRGDSIVLIDSDTDASSDGDLATRPRDRANFERTKKKRQDDKQSSTQTDDDLEIIDAEFAEYITRARNKAMARKTDMDATGDAYGAAAMATNSASQATTDWTAYTGSSFALSGDTASTSATTLQPTSAVPPAQTSSQPPPGDQQYRLFITSHFPQEVPPLLAYVRMDQMMRYAKDAYINHASRNGVNLTEMQAQSVLLTWKGSKIYNFTTGQSLGIKPDAKGRFRDGHGIESSGESGGSSAGFLSGGLHLEIWTEELYEAYLQEEDKRRRRNLGELIEDDLLSDDEAGPGGATNGAKHEAAGNHSAAATQNNRIRLVLTSRDYEKLKITAHSDTTIETLASAFRLQRKIASDKKVVIMWDGDELEGSLTVVEAEIEDMDSVEVHIR
ncbi:hypothetical protein SEPCBS57363_001058 [Sporothrix epigloea]|uniref:Ubiquitin-like domain-containing protein n=1 Tax=Sporothrix epigloea TaxID=1892477 RepID=A0ABP0D9W7_9PEZI